MNETLIGGCVKVVNFRCPLCEKPLQSIVTQQGGPELPNSAVLYYHEDGELHFVVNMARDRYPQEEECPAQELPAQ